MLGGNGGNITHYSSCKNNILTFINKIATIIMQGGNCNNRIMLGGNGGNITHYSSCKNNILTFINKEIATIG